MNFKDDHKKSLIKFLKKKKLLENKSHLSKPISVSSGVEGISTVYLFTIPNKKRQPKLYVAKFELYDKRRLYELQATRKHPNVKKIFKEHVLLPIMGIKESDGFILFEAVHSNTKTGRVDTLKNILSSLLMTELDLCIEALDKLYKVIDGVYYSSGSSSMGGKKGASDWNSRFSEVIKSWNNIEKKLNQSKPAMKHLKGLPGLTSALNSSKVAKSIFNQPVGLAYHSYIHGDLNLTNVLYEIGLDGVPGKAYLIDFALVQEGKPIANDFARIEISLYLHMVDKLNLTDEQACMTILNFFNWLERRFALEYSVAQPYAALIYKLRQNAAKRLNIDKEYVFHDYMTSLYCLSLNALNKWKSVSISASARNAMTMVAGLSLRYLDEHKNVKYKKGSKGFRRLRKAFGADSSSEITFLASAPQVWTNNHARQLWEETCNSKALFHIHKLTVRYHFKNQQGYDVLLDREVKYDIRIKRQLAEWEKIVSMSGTFMFAEFSGTFPLNFCAKPLSNSGKYKVEIKPFFSELHVYNPKIDNPAAGLSISALPKPPNDAESFGYEIRFFESCRLHVSGIDTLVSPVPVQQLIIEEAMHVKTAVHVKSVESPYVVKRNNTWELGAHLLPGEYVAVRWEQKQPGAGDYKF